MSSFADFGKSLVLIGIASLPLIGQAQTVVVTPAVQQDHLPSLRGILPKPEDLSTGRHVREIKYIPLCGHWVQQEQPEVVNGYLLDFLGDLAPEHAPAPPPAS